MKTLVFDIGGIFFHPSWRLEGIDNVSKTLGVSSENFKNALSKEKTLFYTGKILEKIYWENIINELKINDFKSNDLEVMYRSYVCPIPETLALLPKLSSQYTLIACNNCPKEWMDYRIHIASLDNFFSRFFTSGYTGSMKPDNEMYSKVFSMANANVEDMVYIDDDEKYVSLVQKLYGIESFVYEKPEDLLSWIM